MKLEYYSNNKNKNNTKETERVKERALLFSIVRGMFLKVYIPLLYNDIVGLTSNLIVFNIGEMESHSLN